MKFLTTVRSLAFLGLSLFAIAANAHTGLKESTPVEGAIVRAAPEKLELVFNGPVKLIKLELMAAGHAVPVKFEVASEAMAKYSLELPALDAGSFMVNWAAIGADGHTVSNSFGFQIDPHATADHHGGNAAGHHGDNAGPGHGH